MWGKGKRHLACWSRFPAPGALREGPRVLPGGAGSSRDGGLLDPSHPKGKKTLRSPFSSFGSPGSSLGPSMAREVRGARSFSCRHVFMYSSLTDCLM